MAKLSSDPVARYAYLTLANQLYTHPDRLFWAHYPPPCRPIMTQEGRSEVQSMLAGIQLNARQLQAAKALMEQTQKVWVPMEPINAD